MNATPLHTKHIVEHEITTDTHTHLREHGYNIDVTETYLVCSDSGKGYVVQVVETTRVPLDNADVVEDQIEILMCSCPSYRYHAGVNDLEENDELEVELCKHCKRVVDGPAVKHHKAKRDRNQETL